MPKKKPPVSHGDVFHAFVEEARSIGNEVAARRVFDADVEAYLKEVGLTDAFVTWRAARTKR